MLLHSTMPPGSFWRVLFVNRDHPSHSSLQYLQSQIVVPKRPSLVFGTGSALPRKCLDDSVVNVSSGKSTQSTP
jgi:hypothetical protein